MLLADRLLAENLSAITWNWNKFKSSLKVAQKFNVHFDPADIVEEIGGSGEKRETFLETYLKLPFENCWYEWQQSTDSAIEAMLCQQVEDRILMTYFAKDVDEKLSSFGGIRIVGDLKDWGAIEVDTDYYGDDNFDSLTEEQKTEFANIAIIAINRAYWVIALTNAKSIIERKFIEVKEPITRRRMSKKLPLFSHHVVKLRPSDSYGTERLSGDCASGVRAHLVRGHFKICKTGLFWWSPFVRGSAKLGIVTHDYLAEPIEQARTGMANLPDA